MDSTKKHQVFWDVRALLLENPEGSEIRKRWLYEQGCSDADIRRLCRWGLLTSLRRGVFTRTAEGSEPPKREKRPGEDEWRKRAVETRRANKLYFEERRYITTCDWMRQYCRKGERFTVSELYSRHIPYQVIQRLVRNGFIKPVRRGLYEVL